MKTLILCNSDVLSAPLIHHLNSTQELLAVGFPETNAERLKNTFASLNLEGDRMKVFNRSNFTPKSSSLWGTKMFVVVSLVVPNTP